MGVSLRIMSLSFIPTLWTRMVGRIVTTDHNVPSLGWMLHACSSVFFRNGTIKFNVFHFGLLVSFHIANLGIEISGNEVTPGKNCENLHPVKFPMYTCMHVYLNLPSFLPSSLHMYLHKLTSVHTSCVWILVSLVWCSDSSDFEFCSHTNEVSLQSCLQLLINLV